MPKSTAKKFTALFIMLILILSISVSCSANSEIYTCIDDFAHKTVGVATGTIYGPAVEKRLPGAQVDYYPTPSDGFTALTQGKIDAFATNECLIKQGMFEIPELTYIPENLTDNSYGFGFQKATPENDELQKQVNDFISKSKEDGTIDRLEEKWINSDANAEKEIVDFHNLPATNGTLKIAISTSHTPFVFVYNNEPAGFEIELTTLFCKEYGYAPQFDDMQFDSVIPAISSGKYDMAVSNLAITEERAQSIDFSDPHYTCGGVFAILKEHSAELEDGDTQKHLLSDFDNSKIGTVTGGTYDKYAAKKIKNPVFRYYDSQSDLVAACKNEKVDAFLSDYYIGIEITKNEPAMYIVDEHMESLQQAFIFSKDGNSELKREMNEFIDECTEDGTIDNLFAVWSGTDESAKTIDRDFNRSDPLLKIAITSSVGAPYVYAGEKQYKGVEIDIISRFCKKYHYYPKFYDMTFDGLITGVSTGKYAMGAGCISVTDERKQSLDFSHTVYSSPIVIMAEDPGYMDFNTLLQRIAASFEKTFLREDRWQLFCLGLLVTLFIAGASVVAGTALGYGIFLSQRRGNRFADAMTRFFCWLIHGMPVVVLLMILFYIIFGNVSLDGMFVSCIGFTLVFAADFISDLKTGTGAVGKGQTEAGLALGYSERQTFRKIILPQAKEHFMPSYKGHVVSLLKATSVVGYVAVQDLTKVSDIIRSRTYEAFFPLIVTAILYFVLAFVIIQIVKKIDFRSNPEKRIRKIFRNIDSHSEK